MWKLHTRTCKKKKKNLLNSIKKKKSSPIPAYVFTQICMLQLICPTAGVRLDCLNHLYKHSVQFVVWFLPRKVHLILALPILRPILENENLTTASYSLKKKKRSQLLTGHERCNGLSARGDPAVNPTEWHRRHLDSKTSSPPAHHP